ncbi:MAG: two-component system, OmpR family, sensor histidine kinase KdpD, partial [Actinomycetota bacterium]|nr:two-component system, OmpR family, sensor histidine kinase KdpD [Actinomycetota bacterium]
LTGLLLPHRDDLSYATPVLLVLMLVVTVAMVGGMWVALPAALAGALSLNWFFTPPYNTLAVRHADQLVVLGVYLAVALAVSGVVDLAARRTAEAARARAEAHALSTLAGAALGAEQTLPDLLRRVQQTFGMREVALLESIGQEWTTVATTGAAELADGDIELRVAAGPGLQLAVRGPALFATDRRVLTAFADATATALEGWRLAERARAAAQLEAADRMRTALLAAVGHDLRTPLAAAKAAVSSLRQQDVDWQPAEREALLETIEESTDRLQALVANLLDASRLQVGLVSARAAAVGLAEVLDVVMLKLPPADRDRVHLDIADGLPDARADAGLLERVLANILDNALRHAPVGSMVTVSAQTSDGFLQCDVVDHGPGVAANDRARVFAPFQRLDDRGGSGIGLGLAVARGFTEAMGGTLAPRTTPGGGLTMRVCLPLADATPIDSLRTP